MVTVWVLALVHTAPVAASAMKWGHGMNKKETEEAIADSCAVTADRMRYTMAELLAGVEASGAYPLPTEERE